MIVVSSEITNASRAKQPKIHHSCFRGFHATGSFCSTLSIAVSLFIFVAGDLSHKNRDHSSRGSRSEGNDKCFLDLIMLSVKRLCLLLRDGRERWAIQYLFVELRVDCRHSVSHAPDLQLRADKVGKYCPTLAANMSPAHQ